MQSVYKITGIKEIDKALSELEPKLAKKIIRKTLRDSAKIVREEVKQTAPFETGELKAAVKVKAGRRRRNSISVQVQIGEGDFKGQTYYASFLEYGTKDIEPLGFMRKALDNKEDEVREKAKASILQGLEKLANKKIKGGK